MWRESMCFMYPSKENGYWGSKDLIEQAKVHLEEFRSRYPENNAFDLYDNSSGHNAAPEDALKISKININFGCRTKDTVNIRQGWFIKNGQKVYQDFRFQAGDIVHKAIKKDHVLSSEKTAERNYASGFQVQSNSQLEGVLKGSQQILLERKVPFDIATCSHEKQRKECKNWCNQVRQEKQFLETRIKEEPDNATHVASLLSLPTKEELESGLQLDVHVPYVFWKDSRIS